MEGGSNHLRIDGLRTHCSANEKPRGPQLLVFGLFKRKDPPPPTAAIVAGIRGTMICGTQHFILSSLFLGSQAVRAVRPALTSAAIGIICRDDRPDGIR